MEGNRVVIALDGMPLDQVLALASKLDGIAATLKIHDLWDREGPKVVETIKRANKLVRVWVDLKLIDIPKTVELRAKAVKAAGADILTIMAAGDVEMAEAAKKNGPEDIYAVTVLTSMDEEHGHLMFGKPIKAAALYMAERVAEFCDGFVCSPKEVGFLSKQEKLKFHDFATPGIRSAGKDTNDQKRVDTPYNAIVSGSTHLVVGRQITQAMNPDQEFLKILEEIAPAIDARKQAGTWTE